MVGLTLTQRYAPRHLSDIRGSKFVVDYFKAVTRHPESSFRNYVLTGPHGVGKTSLAYAFANDLLGVEDARNTPNYVEIDSFQIKNRDLMLSLKDYIFQEVPGYKVVLLDEFHLVEPEIQAGLLKDIETCLLPIFFFFASTEAEGILDTIISRSHHFVFSRFNQEELATYLDFVCKEEGIDLNPETKKVIVFRSFGHVRDLLNQVDLAVAVGDALYVEETHKVFALVEQLFSSPAKEVVDNLSMFPYTFVQKCFEDFLHYRIIKSKELFREAAIPGLFAYYLKFKRYIKNENDFFSFLHVYADYVAGVRRQHGL